MAMTVAAPRALATATAYSNSVASEPFTVTVGQYSQPRYEFSVDDSTAQLR